MSDKLVVDHILRPVPPWREQTTTECGLDLTDDRRVITRDELVTRAKQLGKTRTMMITCVTCVDTSQRWKDWAHNPGDVIRRDVFRSYGYSEQTGPINAELRAIAALIEAHLDEFHQFLTGLDETSSLDAARMNRRRRGARGIDPRYPRSL